jgi:uncharacterized damage-inducible protein DinB
MTIGLDKAFIDFSCEKLEQLCERICACLEKLDADRIWRRQTESENAIGNLVLHLCGNLRQWIGFGVGRLPDIRQRDLEFLARGSVSPEKLQEELRAAVSEAVAIIRPLTADRLLEMTRIQKYDVTLLWAVYHVVEHFSGHAGQIIFATKQFTGEGMGFYAHLDSARPHSEKAP